MTYERQIRQAMRNITVKGQRVTWVQDAVVPDPVVPWKPGVNTGVNHAVSILFLSATRANKEDARFLPGTDVQTGCLRGLMPAVGFIPTTKDRVIRDGVTLRVETIDPFAPNGEIIYYAIEFAK